MSKNFFQISHLLAAIWGVLISLILMLCKRLNILFEYRTKDEVSANKMRVTIGIVILISALIYLIIIILKWPRIDSWRI